MAASESPVVIEVALSPVERGAPAMDHRQIVAEAVACYEAGAAIIHSHHDSRLDGNGTVAELTEVWGDVLAQCPGAILYPGFVRAANIDGKTGHLEPLAKAGVLGMVPIDPGSVTMGELDEHGLPAMSNQYVNSYADARHIVDIANRCQLGLSVGVFEPGFLRVALAFAKAGLLPSGSLIKLYFGGTRSIYNPGRPAISFGLPPIRESLDAYLAMMQGFDLPWGVRLSGGALLDSAIARLALERGGHLRVGVEDDGGATGATNRELVEAAVALAAAVGRPVAQGQTARDALASTR